MKKIFKVNGLMMLAVCLALAFTSCESDDNYHHGGGGGGGGGYDIKMPQLEVKRIYDVTWNAATVDSRVNNWGDWEYYSPDYSTLGVLVSMSSNPVEGGKFYTTYGLNKGVTDYTTDIFDLHPGTKYTVMAYADDAEMGYTVYSDTKNFTTDPYEPTTGNMQFKGNLYACYTDEHGKIFDADKSYIIFFEDGPNLGHGEEIDFYSDGPVVWESHFFTYVVSDEEMTFDMSFPGNHDFDCTIFVDKISESSMSGWLNDNDHYFQLNYLSGFDEWFRYNPETSYGCQTRNEYAPARIRRALPKDKEIQIMSSRPAFKSGRR